MMQIMKYEVLFIFACLIACTNAFAPNYVHNQHLTSTTSKMLLQNIYDDWRSDTIVDQMPLYKEMVQMCLDELIESNHGQQMI